MAFVRWRTRRSHYGVILVNIFMTTSKEMVLDAYMMTGWNAPACDIVTACVWLQALCLRVYAR